MVGTTGGRPGRSGSAQSPTSVPRVLVVGFSNARAGVESVIANYARAVAGRINFDFLVHEELTNYSDLVEGASANNRVFIIPKKTRDPLRYERGLRALFADHAHEYDAIWDNVCHLANLDALALAKKHKIPQRILHAHMDTIAGKPWHKLFSRFNRPQVHTLPTQLWACSAQSGNGFFNGLDTTVLNNAIAYRDYAYDEEARLAQRAAWGIGEDEILLGAVGRLDVQKNHQWLLETFTELAAANERYRLVIVGAGELHDHLQRTITRLGCQDSARLVGRSTDMPACYSAFDVFVMPSLFEGLPVSIIEAQSAGLRCLLSSRISTDSDISGNCEFLDLEDRGAWLDAITHAQTHDRRHPHLSKDYDLDVQAQRFIDLIAARPQDAMTTGPALFFVDTPLQLLNAILLRRQMLAPDAHADCLVVAQFDCDRLIERLRRSGVFNEVVVVDPIPLDAAHYRRFKLLASHLGDRGTIARALRGDTAYSDFYLSCPTIMSTQTLNVLRRRNPHVRTRFYEDGNGSYNGNVFRTACYLDDPPKGTPPNIRAVDVERTLFRLLNRGRSAYRPTSFHLFQPRLLTISPRFDVQRIETDDESIDVASQVFDAPAATGDRQPRLVVFDAVRTASEKDAGAETIDAVFAGLEPVGGRCAVYEHPRSTQHSDALRALGTRGSGLWEVNCARGYEDALLVAVASSALITPKLIYGHEPHILFLFPLINDLDEGRRATLESAVDMARTLYDDPSRVHVATSADETREFVSRWL